MHKEKTFKLEALIKLPMVWIVVWWCDFKIIGKYSKSKVEKRQWYDSFLTFSIKSKFLIMIIVC